MVDVVSVKFKGRGKVYYFDPNGVKCEAGRQVVVETSKGLELCDCVQGNHTVTDERIVPPLRPVIRMATADDLRVAALCKEREKEAFAICEKKISEHKLEMKLVDAECTFDGSKILFFFTADGRVDFRALVKDLAGVFRTRIELRQIGVRDEAKMLGGIGMCGRAYCCNQFLNDFAPVSTKMAKVQSLSLNPAKISGCCGRLMCCLRYEEQAYEDLVKTVPKVGSFVETVAGYGNVVQVNLLRQTVKVRIDEDNETPKSYPVDEVAVIPGGRPKPGEPLPHVLEIKEKPRETEESQDDWLAPPIFAEDTIESPKDREQPSQGAASRRRKGRGGKKPAVAQPVKPVPESGKSLQSRKEERGKAAAQPKKQQQAKSEGPPAGEGKKGGGRPRYRGKPKQKPRQSGQGQQN